MTLEHLWDSAPPSAVLSRKEIHVWSASLDQPASYVHELGHTLATDERERANRFFFEQDREHFIVARSLLRTILGRYLDVEPSNLRFAYGPHGKPALAEPFGQGKLRFNLAHSQGLALFAVSRELELGIDLEYIRPIPEIDEIAERFFSAQERAMLRAVPVNKKQEGFFNCWTRKEAYLKAIGNGLTRPLDQFAVSLAPEEPARLLRVEGDTQEGGCWSLRTLAPVPGYIGALAVQGRDWSLACWQWTESA